MCKFKEQGVIMNSKCEGCNKLNGMLCPNRGLRKPKYDGCILYNNEEIKESSTKDEEEEIINESSIEAETMDISPEVVNDNIDHPIEEKNNLNRKLSKEELEDMHKTLRDI